MSKLTLIVREVYFKAIRSGEKPEEYRLRKEYWAKRLLNPDGTWRKYDAVVIRNAYKPGAENRLEFPWREPRVETITHPHFGETPAEVFVIPLLKGVKGRLYLSGPMTGLPEHNFPAFAEASARHRAAGFEVVNPAEVAAHLPAGSRWEDYMRADIRALCDCDTIVMLSGWEHSKGAHLELHLAHRMGLNVRFDERGGAS